MHESPARSLIITFVSSLFAVAAWSQPPTAERPAAGPERAAAQRQALISKMWWNQDQKIKQIGLTAEQRSMMDAELESFLEGRKETQKNQRDSLAAFGEALGKGDAARARTLGMEAAQATATPVENQVEMMITVIGMLSDSQRKALTTSYPNLLSRLWIRAAGPRLTLTPGAGGRRPRN